MRKLLIAALAGLCTAGLAAAGGGTAHAGVAGCTGTFQMSPITFDRPSANPGQLLTASTTIQNCTDQTQTAAGYWVAHVVPWDAPLCTGNDPFPMSQVPIAPGGTYTASVIYYISSQCNGTAINVSATVYSSPNLSQTASIPVGGASTSPPPSTCAVTYHNDSEWSTGFVAQVTITNRGTAPVTGWSLTFSYPGDQRVVNAWGATAQQSGNTVTAVNAPWTATIGPGASVSFGMNGSYQRSDAAPSSFVLNGHGCQAS